MDTPDARGTARRVVLAGMAGWLLTACAGPTGSRTRPDGAADGVRGGTAGGAMRQAPTGPNTTYRPPPLPEAALPTPQPAGRAGCPTPGLPDVPQHHLSCLGTTVALTLDDGPDPVWTPRMLDLLAQHDVRATFAVIGRSVREHPELVREVVDAGHQVANHTDTHPDLRRLTPAEVRAEVLRAGDAVERAGGTRPRLFRAPGGHWTPEVLALCAEEQLHPLAWSVDPRDWSRPGAEQIAGVILSQTRPGSIILEHDGGGDRSQTYQALSAALPRLLAAGYRFGHP